MSSASKHHGWWTAIIICVVILLIIITPLSLYATANVETKDLDDAARAQAGGSYVKLPEGVTHYELTGPEDGQVVVLIHGATIPMYLWDEQVEALAKAGYRVLRYDMYGRGYSDRPDGDYSQAFFRKQLLDLLDALKLKQPVDIVGVSMGGAMAVDFTAGYPDRVKDLVLIAPMINSLKNDTNFKLMRIPLLGEFLTRLIAVKVMSDRAAELMQKSPKAAEYAKQFNDQTRFKGFERASLAAARSDAWADYTADYEKVGRQDHRILLIWGTQDNDISPEMVQAMQKALPNVEFKQLDGVGHDPQVEVPDQVNSLILDFLKQQ
ncbi:MAG: alpha/beta hydrolase [Dehalococcoidia bacterium]|nr:alpha/beta hydrolase [Dehalococcoidia bacterium]